MQTWKKTRAAKTALSCSLSPSLNATIITMTMQAGQGYTEAKGTPPQQAHLTDSGERWRGLTARQIKPSRTYSNTYKLSPLSPLPHQTPCLAGNVLSVVALFTDCLVLPVAGCQATGVLAGNHFCRFHWLGTRCERSQRHGRAWDSRPFSCCSSM